MPNHITNKVDAPSHVLATLLNADGKIDFNTILPFTGSFEWNGIDGRAETCAEAISNEPLSNHPLIASMQLSSRATASIAGCSDEQFEQFVQMLRNKRATGYFHTMDFAIAKWGTKWNAYDQVLDLEQGHIQFDTAWSCPRPVFEVLSALHPEAEIFVQFADEDLGSNCGTLIFKAGAIASSDVAGNWNEMTKAEQEKWEAFARNLLGRPAEEESE